MLIGTPQGVIRVYDVIRKPEGERWDPKSILEIRGTPRQPDPSKPGGRIPVRVNLEPDEDRETPEGQEVRVEPDTRRLRITPEILIQHGFTEGCEGCRHKQSKLSGSRPHNETCRARIMEELEKTAEGRRIIERETERIAHRVAEMVQEEENENKEDGPEDQSASEGAHGEAVRLMALRAIEEVQTRIRSQVDVAEIYSPARVTTAAKLIGLRAGLAMDLTNGWDFTRRSHREAAERYVREVKPWLLIGSPECRMFSTLQNLNKNSPHKDRIAKKLKNI